MFGRQMTTVILAAATLAACAVTNDPRQGGLIDGLHGLSSGAYEKRIQQRQDELKRQQNINQQLKDQANTLDKEAQAKDHLLALEQQRVAKLEGNLSILESDVNRLITKSAQQQADVASLNRKIEKLRREVKSQQADIGELDKAGGSSIDPVHYKILMQERDRLAVEYSKLLEYYQALSDASN